MVKNDLKVFRRDPERVQSRSLLRRQVLVVGLRQQQPYYAKWREFDSEDAMRFFALRLREVDMIKSNPQEIIAEGTDWRFLNELKRELKA